MEYLDEVLADAERVIVLIDGDNTGRIHFAPLLHKVDYEALVFFEHRLDGANQTLLHDVRAVAPLEDEDRNDFGLHVLELLELEKAGQNLDDFAADGDLLLKLRSLNNQIDRFLIRKAGQILRNQLQRTGPRHCARVGQPRNDTLDQVGILQRILRVDLNKLLQDVDTFLPLQSVFPIRHAQQLVLQRLKDLSVLRAASIHTQQFVSGRKAHLVL